MWSIEFFAYLTLGICSAALLLRLVARRLGLAFDIPTMERGVARWLLADARGWEARREAKEKASPELAEVR